MKYTETWKKYLDVKVKYDEARVECYEAGKKRNEALEKYKQDIIKLHDKECGCKEWNGEAIIFS